MYKPRFAFPKKYGEGIAAASEYMGAAETPCGKNVPSIIPWQQIWNHCVSEHKVIIVGYCGDNFALANNYDEFIKIMNIRNGYGAKYIYALDLCSLVNMVQCKSIKREWLDELCYEAVAIPGDSFDETLKRWIKYFNV
jgi:hypothetical protein